MEQVVRAKVPKNQMILPRSQSNQGISIVYFSLKTYFNFLFIISFFCFIHPKYSWAEEEPQRVEPADSIETKSKTPEILPSPSPQLSEKIINCKVLQYVSGIARLKVECDTGIGIAYTDSKILVKRITVKARTKLGEREFRIEEENEKKLLSEWTAETVELNLKKQDIDLDELPKIRLTHFLSEETDLILYREAMAKNLKYGNPKKVLDCEYLQPPEMVQIRDKSERMCIGNVLCDQVYSLAICMTYEESCPPAQSCARDDRVKFVTPKVPELKLPTYIPRLEKKPIP